MPAPPIDDQPTSSDLPTQMDHATVDALLAKIQAPWVRALKIQAIEVSEALAILRLPYSPAFRPVEGGVAAQVLMAAVDTAMLVAATAVLGGYRPMATASFNVSFLRGVPAGDVRIVARVLQRMQSLLFIEVELYDGAGELSAHATATYAVPGLNDATSGADVPHPD